MGIGVKELLVIALVVILLFGRGRIAGVMGEFGKGLSSFKKGVQEGKTALEDEKAEAAQDVTPVVKKSKSKA